MPKLKSGQPPPRTIGKCIACALVVKEGEQAGYLGDLYHIACLAGQRRTIEEWRKDVQENNKG